MHNITLALCIVIALVQSFWIRMVVGIDPTIPETVLDKMLPVSKLFIDLNSLSKSWSTSSQSTPSPEHLSLSFEAYNEVFNLQLTRDDTIFGSDSTLMLSSLAGNVTEKITCATYSASFTTPDGEEAYASMTLADDGRSVVGFIARGSETYIVQPTSLVLRLAARTSPSLRSLASTSNTLIYRETDIEDDIGSLLRPLGVDSSGFSPVSIPTMISRDRRLSLWPSCPATPRKATLVLAVDALAYSRFSPQPTPTADEGATSVTTMGTLATGTHMEARREMPHNIGYNTVSGGNRRNMEAGSHTQRITALTNNRHRNMALSDPTSDLTAYIAASLARVNRVFLSQMNLVFSVSALLVKTEADTTEWNYSSSSSCPANNVIAAAVQSFRRNNAAYNGQSVAAMVLLTGCYRDALSDGSPNYSAFYYGTQTSFCRSVQGTSNNNGYASMNSLLWLNMARSLGSILGATVASSSPSGIMSNTATGRLTADPVLGYAVGFQSQSETAMCSLLTSTPAVSPCVSALGAAVCGNGVVEEGEECDAGELGSACCTSKCRFTAGSTCDGADACCVDCVALGRNTRCNAGPYSGYCSRGRCRASACSLNNMDWCISSTATDATTCSEFCQGTTLCAMGSDSTIQEGTGCTLAAPDPVTGSTAGVCALRTSGQLSGSMYCVASEYAWQGPQGVPKDEWDECDCQGRQFRNDICLQSGINVVARSFCRDHVRACISPPTCPEVTKAQWYCHTGNPAAAVPCSAGGWGSCSSGCGTGTRTRAAICRFNGATVSDNECLDAKPLLQETCSSMDQCSFQWMCYTDDPSVPVPCTESAFPAPPPGCGSATVTRNIGCYAGNRRVADAYCADLAQTGTLEPRPIASRATNTTSTCAWQYGLWSACPCSPQGIPTTHTRAATCIDSVTLAQADTWLCQQASSAPETERVCADAPRCGNEAATQFSFAYGEWGACQGACGQGYQSRSVRCVKSSTALAALGAGDTAEIEYATRVRAEQARLQLLFVSRSTVPLETETLPRDVDLSYCGVPEYVRPCVVSSTCTFGQCETTSLPVHFTTEQLPPVTANRGKCVCDGDIYNADCSVRVTVAGLAVQANDVPSGTLVPGAVAVLTWRLVPDEVTSLEATVTVSHPRLFPFHIARTSLSAKTVTLMVPSWLPELNGDEQLTLTLTPLVHTASSTPLTTTIRVAVASPCTTLTCVHGTCNPATATCECSKGYSGKRCDVSICDACNPTGSQCFPATADPAAPCRCLSGFSGPTCSEHNVCSAIECSGNGFGVPAANGCVCQCKNAFRGSACQTCLLCVAANTLDNHECSRCTCKPGFSGVDCGCRAAFLSFYLAPNESISLDTAIKRSIFAAAVADELAAVTALPRKQITVVDASLIDGNLRVNVSASANCGLFSLTSLTDRDTEMATVYAAVDRFRATFSDASMLLSAPLLKYVNTSRGLAAQDALCTSASLCPADVGDVYVPSQSEDPIDPTPPAPAPRPQLYSRNGGTDLEVFVVVITVTLSIAAALAIAYVITFVALGHTLESFLAIFGYQLYPPTSQKTTETVPKASPKAGKACEIPLSNLALRQDPPEDATSQKNDRKAADFGPVGVTSIGEVYRLANDHDMPLSPLSPVGRRGMSAAARGSLAATPMFGGLTPHDHPLSPGLATPRESLMLGSPAAAFEATGTGSRGSLRAESRPRLSVAFTFGMDGPVSSSGFLSPNRAMQSPPVTDAGSPALGPHSEAALARARPSARDVRGTPARTRPGRAGSATVRTLGGPREPQTFVPMAGLLSTGDVDGVDVGDADVMGTQIHNEMDDVSDTPLAAPRPKMAANSSISHTTSLTTHSETSATTTTTTSTTKKGKKRRGTSRARRARSASRGRQSDTTSAATTNTVGADTGGTHSLAHAPVPVPVPLSHQQAISAMYGAARTGYPQMSSYLAGSSAPSGTRSMYGEYSPRTAPVNNGVSIMYRGRWAPKPVMADNAALRTFKQPPAAPSLPVRAHPETNAEPLPPGWVILKSAKGHLYYYNEYTQESRFTRPS